MDADGFGEEGHSVGGAARRREAWWWREPPCGCR